MRGCGQTIDRMFRRVPDNVVFHQKWPDSFLWKATGTWARFQWNCRNIAVLIVNSRFWNSNIFRYITSRVYGSLVYPGESLHLDAYTRKECCFKKEKPHKTTIKSSERRISRGFMVHFCVFDKCSICEKNIGVLRGVHGRWGHMYRKVGKYTLRSGRPNRLFNKESMCYSN